jgi:hypothetical protein
MTRAPHAITPELYGPIVQMLCANLFHPLPPRLNPNGDEYDPEEDEPILEAAWPHLMIVYELFLTFLDMPSFSPATALESINHEFVHELVALFDSEDPRERDYLKTALHRIYGKLMALRPLIRAEITGVFMRVAHEHHPHNGIAELLEILGSIINGFAVPIKAEHVTMLQRALLPLHKAKHVALFHVPLVYCLSQFIEKEQTLAPTIFCFLVDQWPRYRTKHAALRLEELLTLMRMLDNVAFHQIVDIVFPRLAECIESDQFPVVDKALAILRHESLADHIYRCRHAVVPTVLPGLFKASKHNWHEQLQTRAYDIMRQFMEIDRQLFAQCTERYRADTKLKKRAAAVRDDLWKILADRVRLQEQGVPVDKLLPVGPIVAGGSAPQITAAHVAHFKQLLATPVLHAMTTSASSSSTPHTSASYESELLPENTSSRASASADYSTPVSYSPLRFAPAAPAAPAPTPGDSMMSALAAAKSVKKSGKHKEKGSTHKDDKQKRSKHKADLPEKADKEKGEREKAKKKNSSSGENNSNKKKKKKLQQVSPSASASTSESLGWSPPPYAHHAQRVAQQ